MSPAFITNPLPAACRRTHARPPSCTAAPIPPEKLPAIPVVQTPTQWRFPLIGYLLDKALDKLDAPRQARRYGPVYRSDFLGIPVTIVTDFAAITAAYKDETTFRSNDACPAYMLTLIGKSVLIFHDGHAHSRKRKALAPAFTPLLFPSYFPSINSSAQTLWQTVTAIKEGTTLRQHIQAHNLRVIVKVVTGLPPDDARFPLLRELFDRLTKGLNTLPYGHIWQDALAAREELLKMFEGFVRTMLKDHAPHIAELRSYGEDLPRRAAKQIVKGSLDVVTVAVAMSDLQLKPGAHHDPLVMRELTENVLSLFFAGYFTQTNSALSCIFEIGFNETVRRRLEEEQESLIEDAGGVRGITLEQVRGMPLLDSFITEVLRLYPPGSSVFRRVGRDTTLCGHALREGTIVQLDFWAAHRDAKYYEQPDELIMDRFVPGDGPPPPKTLAFGALGGPHYCLGTALAKINLKTTISEMLRRYDIVLDPKQTKKYSFVPEMQPRSGVKVLRCEKKVVP